MKKLMAVLLAVMILAALAIPVFADNDETIPSPSSKQYVTVYYLDDGGKDKVEIHHEVPRYIDQPKYVFDNLEVTGTYELVPTGNGLFTMIAHSDLWIKTKQAPTVPTDHGSESPNTGASILDYWYVLAIAVVAMAGIVLVTKKLIKTR